MPRSPEFDTGLSFWKNLFAPREKSRPAYVNADEISASQDLKSLGLRDSTQPLGEIYPNGRPEDQT